MLCKQIFRIGRIAIMCQYYYICGRHVDKPETIYPVIRHLGSLLEPLRGKALPSCHWYHGLLFLNLQLGMGSTVAITSATAIK